MNTLSADFLLLSIAIPLAVALAIALGLPKRFAVKLAYVGLVHPLSSHSTCCPSFRAMRVAVTFS